MHERNLSIVDKVTPTQVRAWEYEHQARVEANSGNTIMARYLFDQGRALRHIEMHEKIVTLFDYSDAQNAIIAIGLNLKQKVSIFERKNT